MQTIRQQDESSNGCDRSISGTVIIQIERGHSALSIPTEFSHRRSKSSAKENSAVIYKHTFMEHFEASRWVKWFV